ncbi:MAG: hypothetical protein HOY71_42980, partial [Nonomuraea sp.]|nr:hypothetical protein [Nonomuraea sp.]
VMAVACVDAPGEHLLDDVAGYLDAYRRTAACVLRGDTVYCLMPAQDMAALGEVAAQLTVRLGLRRRLLAGVGSRVGAEELATSRRHADLVLSVLRGSGGAAGASATIDDVRATAALVELRSLLDDQPQLLVHLADPDTRLVTWLRLRAGSAPGRG